MTIGELTAEVADEMVQHQENDPAMRKRFQHAKGETDFYADGTFVHIRCEDGHAEWKETKVGVLTKRKQGESTLPEDWAKRELPKPSVVSAFAVVGDKETFQERCQQEGEKLEVRS